MNGLSPASSAAATRNVAPITAADAPSSSRRSGASTSSVPNISPTRTISHMPAAIRGSRSAASTELIAAAARRAARGAQRPHQQPRARQRDAAEHDLRAERHRGGAEHRPAERADDRRRHRRADQLAAALARRRADQPPDRARPRGGAAEALDEAGEVEHEDAVREREGERGRDQRREAEHDGRPHADAGGQPAAGQRAEERPGGVGGREDPRAGLERSKSAA